MSCSGNISSETVVVINIKLPEGEKDIFITFAAGTVTFALICPGETVAFHQVFGLKVSSAVVGGCKSLRNFELDWTIQMCGWMLGQLTRLLRKP